MKIKELSPEAKEALDNEEAVSLYSEYRAEGYPLLISKKQFAEISGCSISTVDNQIKNGYGLPNYKKVGAAKNAKVLFSLIDVCNFFSAQTIQTA